MSNGLISFSLIYKHKWVSEMLLMSNGLIFLIYKQKQVSVNIVVHVEWIILP